MSYIPMIDGTGNVYAYQFVMPEIPKEISNAPKLFQYINTIRCPVRKKFAIEWARWYMISCVEFSYPEIKFDKSQADAMKIKICNAYHSDRLESSL